MDHTVLELLNKDVVILRFEYAAELHVILSIESLVNPEYAPPPIVRVDGSICDEDLRRWWTHRVIPTSRLWFDRLLEALDIESWNPVELIERNHALSLSDRYWVREAGSSLTWEDVNFFDNSFSEALGHVTLDTPINPIQVDATSIDFMSPDSTTGGNLQKRWTIGEDGRRYLLKSGSAPLRQDVYNEVVATSLHEKVLDSSEFVPYGLVKIEDRTCCCCPNMLGDDEELVTAADILWRYRKDDGFGTYPHVVRILSSTGINREIIEAWLSKMFSCDFILANDDRHLNNFGLIRDCRTLEYKRPAPIYDSGLSLWSHQKNLDNPSDYDYVPQPFLGRPAESRYQQLKLFDDYRWLPSVDLHEWIEDAIGILADIPMMSESRIDAIEHGLKRNVQVFEEHVVRMSELFPAHAPSWLAQRESTLVRR